MNRFDLLEKIKLHTAQVFGVSMSQLIGKCRDVELVDARHTCIQVMLDYKFATPKIARAMNFTNHASVLHVKKTYESRAKQRWLIPLYLQIKSLVNPQKAEITCNPVFFSGITSTPTRAWR